LIIAALKAALAESQQRGLYQLAKSKLKRITQINHSLISYVIKAALEFLEAKLVALEIGDDSLAAVVFDEGRLILKTPKDL
jgi:hypothetical protein